MASIKSSTSKNSHRSTIRAARNSHKVKMNPAQKVLGEAAFGYFLGEMLLPVGGSPVYLTRSQRLRLADLQKATGISAEVWIGRAMDNFLEDEAPIRMMSARHANRSVR